MDNLIATRADETALAPASSLWQRETRAGLEAMADGHPHYSCAGIFTLVSTPAAAGTTTPGGSAHGDKLTRQRFRPSSSHPGTQTLGSWTNKLFILQSVVFLYCYNGSFPNSSGNFVQNKSEAMLASAVQEGRRDAPASHGNQSPRHTGADHTSPQDSLGQERHRVIISPLPRTALGEAQSY